MAHPDLEHAVALRRGKVFNAFEQFGVAVGAHLGITKLARGAGFHLAAQLLRHGLHAVANTQHGNTEFKHGIRCAVVHFVHAGVRAGQDDAFEVAVFGVLAHPVAADIAGVDFAKHMGFAHASGNQLGDLRAEVENQNFGMLHSINMLRDGGGIRYKQCLHTVNQRRQMTRNHGLDSQCIYIAQVVVHKDIAKAADFSPRNGRKLRLEIIGKHLRGLAKRL